MEGGYESQNTEQFKFVIQEMNEVFGSSNCYFSLVKLPYANTEWAR